MKTSNLKEQEALESATRIATAEANRAAFWDNIAPQHKKRALMIAGLDPRRQYDGLEKFSIDERALMMLCISSHCGQMEIIARCLQDVRASIPLYPAPTGMTH